MIESLKIRGLALIDHLEVAFGEGLTVLSGETGAGKTVLVEALNLAMGQRADAGLIREGCAEASVAARFVFDRGPRLLERRVSSQGRNRSLLDGKQVTAQALAEAAERSVDLHGQHEHQRLLHQRWHSEYLDGFAGEEALAAREAYRAALLSAERAARTLAGLAEAEADRERLEGRLRHEIADIGQAAPSREEDEELASRLPVLRHASRLAETVGAARDRLESPPEGAGAASEGAREGALDGVREALELVGSVRDLDPRLDELADQVTRGLAELDDVAGALARYLDDLDMDPTTHAEAEERAAVFARLKERYGGRTRDMGAVLAYLDEAKTTLDALEGGDERREQVACELAEALGRIHEEAERLRAVRFEAAPRFARGVEKAVRGLAMPDARFVVEMSPIEAPGAGDALAALPRDGLDVVEFLFSANAGEAVRPLGRVASGGELSRLMLAVKVVLGESDPADTLVFDEIDAGIGGETAVAVAEALRALAAGRQVLVITHLPQIAAVADHNIVVEKRTADGRTVTVVRAVDGEGLEAELARMLAGDTESEASLTHARELLAGRGGG